MSLSRKAKIWIIILSIPVVLIVGAAVAIKLYFTGERLKAFVIPKIEEATGRKVAIKTIDLSIFPTLAVEIDSLSISNKKGFTDKPFIALDKLVLNVRLAALLKGSLEVTTMVLERPWMLLEVNEKGITNYSLEKKAEAPTVEKKPEPKTNVTVTAKTEGYGFLLSNFQIVDGSIEYVDRKGNSATRIAGLNQKVRMEGIPVVNQLKIETDGSIERLSYGSFTTPLVSNLRIASSATLLYEQSKDLLTIQEGSAALQDIALNVSGTVAGLTAVPVMDIVIGSDKVNIADLFSLIPKEYMKKAEGLKGNGTAQVKITIKGTVTDSTNPDVFGTVSATNATLQYAQLPKPITNVNIVSDFARTRTKMEFRMQKFSATLGNNPLSGTLTVANVPVKASRHPSGEDDYSMTMTLDASLNLAEIRQYYPLESGTDLTGMLKTNVNLDGKVANPQAMKASGSMEFQNVTIRSASSKNPIQNLQGSITFNNQIVEAKKLSMTLGKSDLALSFWLKNYLSMMSEDKTAPKPVANLTLTSTHLYTADIMGEPKQETKTLAQTSAPPVASSAKAAKVEKPQQAGVPLPNVDMDVSATISTLTMEKFELSNVRGTMKISNGIIAMQNFSCNTFDGSIITKGTLNLQKPDRPTFDFAMDMNGLDAHAMLPKFTSFGERMFGKLTMNTTLKGALDDTLGLIPQSLNGEGRVQAENGKLTGVKVNKAVGDLLKLPDLEQINFKDWANSFTITDGRVYIKDLKIKALDADYVVDGSQGLDGSLDFAMSLVLPEKTSSRISVAGFAGQAVDLFKDESGRVKLDFTVGGTSDNPKVALNTKSAQKKAEDLVKQKLEGEKKKVEETLKKKAGDALKDLFKKKK
jgi:uncharacterized protein involved in outer membrane biogenesis